MNHDISFHFVRLLQSTIASGTGVMPSTPVEESHSPPYDELDRLLVLNFCQKALSMFIKHSQPGITMNEDGFMHELQEAHARFLLDLRPSVRLMQELNLEAFTSFLSGEQVYG